LPSLLAAHPARVCAPGRFASPLKTRVGGFCAGRATRARKNRAQVAQSRRVARGTATKTASGAHETGLVYYGKRFYSPSLGRFINRDPIEESGGLNLYGFCGNNSVNRWDVLGMYETWFENDTQIGFHGDPDPSWTAHTTPYYTYYTSASGKMCLYYESFSYEDTSAPPVDECVDSFGPLSYGENTNQPGWGSDIDDWSSYCTAVTVATLEAKGDFSLSRPKGCTLSELLGIGRNAHEDVQIGQLQSLGVVDQPVDTPVAQTPSNYTSSSNADWNNLSALERATRTVDANSQPSRPGDFAAIQQAAQGTFGNDVFQKPLTTLAAGGAQTIALVGAVYTGVAAAPVLLKDIHIEAKGRGTIVQVRYGNTPLVRLDYNRYQGSQGQPRLHLNVGPDTTNIHIPLDPRSWFEGPGG